MAACATVYCTSALPLGVCLSKNPSESLVLCIQRGLFKKMGLTMWGGFVSSVMSCGMPVPPVNGSIVGQDFSLGARAAYQCIPGFRLAGSVTNSVICQESGRWSPTEAPPRCVREYALTLAALIWVTLAVFTNETKVYEMFSLICLTSDPFKRWLVPTLATRLWNTGDGDWYMEPKTNMMLSWCLYVTQDTTTGDKGSFVARSTEPGTIQIPDQSVTVCVALPPKDLI